jgi:FdhD protein
VTRPQAPAVSTRRWANGRWGEAEDRLAAEEPLQILLDAQPLSVLMRTPGHDLELALGLLWSEQVITDRGQIRRVRISAEAEEPAAGSVEAGLVQTDLVEANEVDVHLAPGSGRRIQRTFLSSSACGVCGATTIADLARDFQTLPTGPRVDPSLLVELADRLRSRQSLFESTGGLHAAGLFTAAGESLTVREDVGRHNAVDKVVGRALLDGRLPCSDLLLVVSGRGGYEIVQKAVAAGIPVVAAVGAPSSLAVATARRFDLTLAGFLRDGRFNVYSAPERLT